MKGTEHEGFYASLFTIHVQNVTQCIDVEYESARNESFTVLTVPVQKATRIEEAIHRMLQTEMMEGENAGRR